MRNRNLLVLIIVILLAAVVAVIGFNIPQAKRTVTPSATLAPEAQPSESPAETGEETKELADAYLLVTVGGVLYEPIAIYEEGSYTIRQGDEIENVIHVTPDSVTMESSTCDNQDCVLQGTVTLENMTKRVLANMIICLPNEITLELHTPQTLADALLQIETE